jgi:hypothetical protein
MSAVLDLEDNMKRSWFLALGAVVMMSATARAEGPRAAADIQCGTPEYRPFADAVIKAAKTMRSLKRDPVALAWVTTCSIDTEQANPGEPPVIPGSDAAQKKFVLIGQMDNWCSWQFSFKKGRQPGTWTLTKFKYHCSEDAGE